MEQGTFKIYTTLFRPAMSNPNGPLS